MLQICAHLVRTGTTPFTRTLQASRFRAMTSISDTNKLRIALCQFNVGSVKEDNIKRAASAIDEAKSANLLVLPECWNSPYAVTSFPTYAEPVPSVGEQVDESCSPSVSLLVNKAKEHGVFIIGGSVPEREGANVYNTCVIVNPQGEIVGKHRKVHLFDINVPGRITFKESDSLTAGQTPTLVNTPWGAIGVGICYDIRFPEYAMLLRKKGAKILVYPGAFNMVTGPAHWELLQRARAVDNQLFVATCSPARDTSNSGGYVAWGHSTVVSPWGEILAKAEEGEAVVFADMEISKADEMRENIPCWKQKRDDLYELHIKANL